MNNNSERSELTVGYSAMEKNPEFKVTVDICGGLANQLFQIAVTLYYAKKFGHKPVFNNVKILPNYTSRHTYWEVLNTTNLLTIENININDYIVYNVKEEFNYTDLNYIPANVMLRGYYQTSKFLDEIRFDFLNLLVSNKNINDIVTKSYNNIKNKFKTENLISLHIRRTDYIKFSHVHTNLGMDYYVEAIKKLCIAPLIAEGIDDTYPIIVFSDDYNWCKNNLSKYFTNPIYFVCDENITSMTEYVDYIELLLMSKMKYNIMANSSYSWFAAYMNNNEDKKIIAPSRWFEKGSGYKDWSCLYCKDWIVI
jgi:hypothetical protein